MLQKNTVKTSTLELLRKLQTTDELKNFHLAGGTSLALQIGHRKSIDLDLFTQEGFDTNYILEFLEERFDFRLDFSSKNTLKGSIDKIKIDIISHKYALVNPIIEIENIRLYSIQDITAMKLNAIAGNGTRSKDFIDIYFILKQFSVKEILCFYKKKYKSRNVLHILKSLNYFDDISIQDWPEMILEKKLTVAKVREVIEGYVKDFSTNL